MKPSNRTFVISGGCSGLGLATAKNLHADGAYVALLDINAEAGEKVVKDFGGRAKFFEVDVRDSDSIAKAIEGTAQWVKQTGMEIGGLIPAAGVGFPAKVECFIATIFTLQSILTNVQLIDGRTGKPTPMDSIDFVLNVNLRGTIDLIRQTLPHMINVKPLPPDGERGVIIMVASSAAFDGQPGQVSYAASKGGVASLTLPLSRDLARYGIRAVTIAPALFESAMTARMGDKVRKSLERVMEFPVRAGKPEEFASLARQIVENGMLNGTVVRLDGAMRMPSKM